MDLKTQLGNLIQLQSIDSQIYLLKLEIERKPEEIKALEAAFDEKKQGLAQLEKASLDLQKQKKDFELELSAKEENVKKLQTQLYSLKTNKEYNAMLQQINDTKADASFAEDKIIKSFEQIDKIKLDIEEEKKKLIGEEKIFSEQKKKCDDRIKEINSVLATLESQRSQALSAVDPKILSQYERILKGREGLAIATVKDNSCSGCHMLVSPQVINSIQMYDRLVTCGTCNRILYIEKE